MLFIAFSDNDIGIDAEILSRNVYYTSIVRKFHPDEQNEILSSIDFLHHWTAKEASIKFLNGTIGKDLSQLAFIKGKMYYKNLPLPVFLTFRQLGDTLIAICSTRNIKTVQFEKF